MTTLRILPSRSISLLSHASRYIVFDELQSSQWTLGVINLLTSARLCTISLAQVLTGLGLLNIVSLKLTMPEVHPYLGSMTR